MKENKGITLKELFVSILNRWYIVLTMVVLGLVLAAFLAFVVVKPKYSSSAEVIAHVYKTNQESPDLLDTARMLDTVAYHFKTDLVLEDVIKELETTTLTPKAISSNLKITSSNSNFYIRITYTNIDPEFARKVTQQIVDSAKTIATGELEEALGNIFTVTSKPKLGVYTSPNKFLYLAVGFLLGAISGALLVFAIEFGRYTYKTKDDIEADLGLQVIGVIPEYEVGESRR